MDISLHLVMFPGYFFLQCCILTVMSGSSKHDGTEKTEFNRNKLNTKALMELRIYQQGVMEPV